MDNFENNPLEHENSKSESYVNMHKEEPQGVFEQSATDRSDRKTSPFEDSPYEKKVPDDRYAWNNQATHDDSNVNTDHEPEKKAKKHSDKSWRAVLAGAIAVVLIGGSIAGTAAVVNHQWEEKTEDMQEAFNDRFETLQKQLNQQGNTPIISGGQMITSDGLTPSQIYSQNVQSVVAISNRATTKNFYGQISETASSGSGFILTEDGYVVTNYHVIKGATELKVILYDETEYEAKVIGFEESNDLALLKVDGKNLPAVTIGHSDNLIVGDMVVAIGNPLGELTSTQTVGYVSAINRDVTTAGKTINMLQTDAAINPGNSGGPLFNAKGEVVGITTAKYSGLTNSGASIEGIGFAIPIDDVIGMISDLKEFGYVTGAYLGVIIRNMDPKAAEAYSLPLGAFVDKVSEGFCAEKAGVMPKDIIIGMNDQKVENITDLTRILRKFDAGDTITLKVFRSGQELTLTVTLDEKPQNLPEPEIQKPDPGEHEQMPDEGSYDEWREYFEKEFGKIFGF